MATKKVAKVATFFYCEICDYNTSRKCNYTKHILTSKHILATNGNKKSSESSESSEILYDQIYICEICDYNTSRKCNYTKHILTSKHILATNSKKSSESSESSEIVYEPDYVCKICNKIYHDRSGLWKHQQKCIDKDKVTSVKTEEPTGFTPQMFSDLLKQNNELTKQIIELSSKPTINNSNNNNNNSFNLQFFLNETCKDALNISDFVSQLQVGIKDLEETGRLGYAEGISKIFINGLKQLDVSQRPVHCSDYKRETMYIKDENIWEKEDVTHLKLTNAIKDVAHKNIQQIPFWTLKYPQHKDITSKCNDTYMKLVSEAMSGTTMEESDKNYKKIAKNIMKETVIDK